MSLVVSAYWLDPLTGQYEQFTDWDDGHHMAGTESGRRDLWGTEAMRRRGATFLPQLAETNVYVQPEELDAFAAEVQRLLADLDGLRAELGRGPDCLLPHYLDNFLRAVEYARARGGGVMIE